MASSVAFSGLSSGLDTDSIVEALCATAASKVTKSEQAEETIEIKQEVWKDINSKVYSFYTGLDKIRMSGSFSAIKASSSSTNVATILSEANLEEGNHVLKVTQLAEKAILETKKVTYTDSTTGKLTTAKKDTKLSDVLQNVGGTNGITITASNGTTTTDITLNENMTIEDLEKELSSALDNCSVKYNESLGTFSVYSKETGSEQVISLSAKDANGDSTNTLAALGFTTTYAEGKNLKATYDGMEVDYASNDFEVAGSTSSSTVKISVTGTGTTTLSASKDTDGVYDMIKSFVDDYNSLIEEISTLVDAEYSKLEPLTDEEKEEMSEKEIEEYNEELKAAALRNDTTLQSLRTSLRRIISDTKITGADGKTITLSSIGITTSSNYRENGKLTIDEEKLKAAIANNPDDVTALFTSRKNNAGEGEEGIATKLYSKLKESFKGTTQKSTGCLYNDKVLTNNLKSQKKETSTLEERLEQLKERYYSKFTAMETMLATINSQSSTIASYFTAQ